MCIIELELRTKNQRVAYYETKPMIDKFKVLGQLMTSELGLITQKSEKCDFADNFISEQARVAI